jgi:hypothetical protein
VEAEEVEARSRRYVSFGGFTRNWQRKTENFFGQGAILNESAQGRLSNDRRSWLVKGQLAGESDNHESDTYNSNTLRRTPRAPREAIDEATDKAVKQASDQAGGCETRREAGSESSSAAARTGALQIVQAGLGGDCGTDSECAGHAICLPVLSEIAPCSRAGAWVQESAARPMGALAPRGGIRKRWHVH